MLLFVAIQHALLSARLERVDDRVIAASAGIVTLASGNLAIGFGVGVAMVLLRVGFRMLIATRVPGRA
jgi:hypothetical protein